MSADRWAIETCLKHFQLPTEAEEVVAGEPGRQYMAMLWQEEGYAMAHEKECPVVSLDTW